MSYITSQKRVIAQALQVVDLVKLEFMLHGVKAAGSRLIGLQAEFEAWCKESVTRVNWYAIAYTLNQAKPRRSKEDMTKELEQATGELMKLLNLATN